MHAKVEFVLEVVRNTFVNLANNWQVIGRQLNKVRAFARIEAVDVSPHSTMQPLNKLPLPRAILYGTTTPTNPFTEWRLLKNLKSA